MLSHPQKSQWINFLFWSLALALMLFIYWPSAAKTLLLLDDEEMFLNYVYYHPVNASNFFAILTDSYQGLFIPLTRALWGGLIWGLQIANGESYNSEMLIRPLVFLNMALLLATGFVFKKLLELIEGPKWWHFPAAVIFMFHPLQVENVAWSMGAKELLWIVFALLALVSFVKGRNYRCQIFVALAMLSKPTAAVLPLFFILFYVTDIGVKRTWRELLGILIPQIYLIALAIYAGRLQEIIHHPSIAERLQVLPDTFGFYISKLLWPSDLVADYGRTTARVLALGFTKEMLIFFVSGIVFTTLAYRCPAARKKIILLAGFFFIALLPASGLIAFSFQEYSNVADHYATFSIMALALLFCFLKITNLWRGVVAFLFLLPFLYQSHLTNTYWSDSKTFYNHILEVNPASYMAVGSLGILSFRQGDFKEAKIKFKTADEMNPQHVYAAINLANLLFSEGDREAAGKIYATKAAEVPENALIHYEFGKYLWKKDNFEKSVEEYQRAAELAPDSGKYRKNLKKAKDLLEDIQSIKNRGKK